MVIPRITDPIKAKTIEAIIPNRREPPTPFSRNPKVPPTINPMTAKIDPNKPSSSSFFSWSSDCSESSNLS